MKLELKHITAYDLEKLVFMLIDDDGRGFRDKIQSISVDYGVIDFKNWEPVSIIDSEEMERIKPILRPLSDLTKEQGQELKDLVKGSSMIKNHLVNSLIRVDLPLNYVISKTPYCIIEKLLEWGFDIFGLIKNGLAVDVNTIEY